MKNAVGIGAIALIAFSLNVHSVTIDPTDYVLVAYRLTADQESQFDAKDGKSSSFWSMWDNNDALDYVHELPSTHGTATLSPDQQGAYYENLDGSAPARIPGFTDGEDDAQLWGRAAWGTQGLYLYVEILDDEFVGLVSNTEIDPVEGDYGHVGADYWMNDCAEFALDIYSSEEQKSHYVPRFSQETETYFQYLYRLGPVAGSNTTIRVSSFNVNHSVYPDESGRGLGDTWGWIMEPHDVSMAELGTNYGIKMETYSGGEKKRACEWFLPWRSVASGINEPSVGQRIALTMGYLDMDGTEDKQPDFLSLKNYGNQFTTRPVYNGVKISHGAGDNWGDIEFAGNLDDQITKARLARSRSVVHTTGISSDYFAINGIKLASPGKASTAGMANAIVVTRSVLPGGGIVTGKKIVH
jgi:hypothetical protein